LTVTISLVAAAMGLGGCGVTGSVAPFTAAIEPLPEARQVALRVGRVWVAPTAAVNNAHGAYNWGRFGENDRTAVETSLQRTFAATGVSSRPEAPVVRVAISRYMLAFTNSRISVLAVVDWCVDREGRMENEQRFFATYDSGEGLRLTTLGAAKTRINQAVVETIVRRAIALETGKPRPPNPQLVFDTRWEAIGVLPSEIAGMHPPEIIHQMGAAMLGGTSGPTRFDRNSEPPDTDWDLVIEAEKAAAKARSGRSDHSETGANR